jgi:hypothetical protein
VHQCECVATHHPSVVAPQDHHIVPQSWVARGAVQIGIVPLCGTSHDSVHSLLNEYVSHGGTPPWGDHRHPGDASGRVRMGRQRYGLLVRRLAERAWRNRPSARPPYTLAAGGDGEIAEA